MLVVSKALSNAAYVHHFEEHSVVGRVTPCNSRIHIELFPWSLRIQPVVITVPVVLGDLPGTSVWHLEIRGEEEGKLGRNTG